MPKNSSTRNIWSLKKQILLLYFAFKDPRTPWYAKATALSALIYLLSPVDFIPDVMPFVGYLDDLVIVPVLISVAISLLPQEVKRIARQRAAAKSKKWTWIMILLGVLFAGLLALFFYRLSIKTSRTIHPSAMYSLSGNHAYTLN